MSLLVPITMKKKYNKIDNNTGIKKIKNWKKWRIFSSKPVIVNIKNDNINHISENKDIVTKELLCKNKKNI